MRHTIDDILAVFDQACLDFNFPGLDNAYVYLAATRLSAFRSKDDWAFVIEIFGFSPRVEDPDVTVFTFASTLLNRRTTSDYLTPEAFVSYLANNPQNETRTFFPVEPGDWKDAEECEFVSASAKEVIVRGWRIPIPSRAEYANHGIELESPNRVAVFELCRYLACVARPLVLASPEELRSNVPPHLDQVLQLDEWRHPDVYGEERPSASPAMRQIAEVMVSGDVLRYRPSEPSNTHWRHWPEGGRY